MAFQPSSVDLSLVEPGLRREVLRRIIILENLAASSGPRARLEACKALGITVHQLYILSRAWRARRRAEDVTLRATKRSKPSPLAADVIALIAATADALPGATVMEIATEVKRAALARRLTAPTYPTVNKHVREHRSIAGRRAAIDIGGDLHVDVAVSDIPVATADGHRVRPNLLLLIDGGTGAIVDIAALVDAVEPADVVELLRRAGARTAAFDDAAGAHGPTRSAALTLPIGTPSPEAVARLLDPIEFHVMARAGAAAPPGALTTMLLGTQLGGYKLRPRLVGRDRSRRAAGHAGIEAAAAAEAAHYLLAHARAREAGTDAGPPTGVDERSRGDFVATHDVPTGRSTA